MKLTGHAVLARVVFDRNETKTGGEFCVPAKVAPERASSPRVLEEDEMPNIEVTVSIEISRTKGELVKARRIRLNDPLMSTLHQKQSSMDCYIRVSRERLN